MIAGVILAAGDSSRMGFPKQLAENKGKTILETVVETVTSNLDETVVVLGHENDTITEKLDFKESTILINENWEEGIVSSIRTALFYLSENNEIDSAMIFMADQPSVNNKIIDILKSIIIDNVASLEALELLFFDTKGNLVFKDGIFASFLKKICPKFCFTSSPTLRCLWLILPDSKFLKISHH